MYLAQISEFVTFLAARQNTLQQILDQLVRVILTPWEIDSIHIVHLNENNEFIGLQRSGMSRKNQDLFLDTWNFDEKTPAVDAIQSGKTLWINTLPDWGDEYPLMKKLPADFNAKTYIAFPLLDDLTPIGVIGIYSRVIMEPDEDFELFLRAVGDIFSFYFCRNKLDITLHLDHAIN